MKTKNVIISEWVEVDWMSLGKNTLQLYLTLYYVRWVPVTTLP